jgi:hypothetical protein
MCYFQYFPLKYLYITHEYNLVVTIIYFPNIPNELVERYRSWCEKKVGISKLSFILFKIKYFIFSVFLTASYKTAIT